MKKVWISILGKSEDSAKKIMGMVKGYGLEPNGHFWSDDLQKSMWMGPRAELQDKDVAVWVILGAKPAYENIETRIGLSFLSMAVQAQRGHGFPVIILHDDKDKLTPADLPTPLRHADLIPAGSSTLGAKLVAKANTPFKPAPADYRIDAYGLAGLGNWIEVGPVGHKWSGVLLGVAGEGADVAAHGVGVKGQLPRDKMVLEYQQKGLKIKLGETEYIAWALRNEIDENNSYYAKVVGKPTSLLFGEFSESDEAEVFVLQL